MEIKKFYATSVPAAMRDIRRALGSDAVILATRSLPPSSGVLLADGRATIEVTAGRETRSAEPRSAPWTENSAPKPEPKPSTRAASVASPPKSAPSPLAAVLAEIQSLRTLLGDEPKSKTPVRPVPSRQQLPEPDLRNAADSEEILPARLLQKRLIEQGVEAVLAKRIVDRMAFHRAEADAEDERGTFRQFARTVQGFLPAAKPPDTRGRRPRKIALVGPTGVGKTTTIAKLASRSALHNNRQVALVTLDTYRIAAADQLKTYARLLGVPLDVASAPDRFAASLDRFSDADEIYIDTPGYSPRDEASISRLAASFKDHSDIEMHLLLTCSTRYQEMRGIVERFLPLGYDRLLFTKLDEASAVGDLLNAWIMAGYSVSYFTTGQRVPEDLEEALAETICRRLLAPVE